MNIYHFMPTIDAILKQIPNNTGVADASLSFNKTGDGMLFATYATLDGEAFYIKMNYRTQRDEEWNDDESDIPTDVNGHLEMEFYQAGRMTITLYKTTLTVIERRGGVQKRPVTRGKWIHEEMKNACITATVKLKEVQRMREMMQKNSK